MYVCMYLCVCMSVYVGVDTFLINSGLWGDLNNEKKVCMCVYVCIYVCVCMCE